MSAFSRLTGWLSCRRRVPVLYQLSATECGSACLAMILSYHGRETTVAECREKFKPGRDGLTARTIAAAARDYGLRVNAYSLELDHLRYLPLPLIAHWEFKHFVIVERVSPKAIEIVDPARGRRTLTVAEFSAAFTGVVLACEPGVHFETKGQAEVASWRGYLKTLLRLPGAKKGLAQVLGASLVLQLIGLLLPLLTKVLVDYVLPYRANGVMTILGVGALSIVAAQSVMSFLRSSLMIHLRARLDSHQMRGFFEHLLALPFSFFQKRTSGDLLMRLNSISFIREVLTNNMLSVMLDGTFVIVYLLVILQVAPTVVLLVMALAAAQVIILLCSQKKVALLVQRELAAKSEEQGYLTEAVASVCMLKATGAEDRAFDRWSDLFSNQLNVSLERNRLSLALETALGSIRTVSPLLLLWFGALRVLDGEMSLGSMLAINAVAAAFLSPVAALVTNAQQFQLVGAHLQRVTDVLEAKPEQTAQERGTTRKLSGRVEVRDLSFRYDPTGPLVLRDISFTVEPGRKVAVVGSTGSGKSTLAMLLLGLYAPTHGAILYDAVPLSEYNYRSLRGQMGVVLQESFLLSGSILHNITLNNPDASLEKVARSATAAGLAEDILQMPMGYETFVSERGTTLSGGQRQRLALARALLHEPSILLLDEATSHLDLRTEAEVDENLNHLSCTRIVIAHRLSTIRNADLILVLHEGALVEQGTHEELLTKGGHYAALTSKQAISDPARTAGVVETGMQTAAPFVN